jgi:hypothetical protein
MQYFQTHQDTEACYNHRQIYSDKHRKYIIGPPSPETMLMNTSVIMATMNYCGICTNEIVTGERGIRLNMRINI